jgi:hypothetical protein
MSLASGKSFHLCPDVQDVASGQGLVAGQGVEHDHSILVLERDPVMTTTGMDTTKN